MYAIHHRVTKEAWERLVNPAGTEQMADLASLEYRYRCLFVLYLLLHTRGFFFHENLFCGCIGFYRNHGLIFSIICPGSLRSKRSDRCEGSNWSSWRPCKSGFIYDVMVM